MQALPYYTSHTPLALALQQAGEPLLDLWNVYTPDKIRELGCENMLEAVRRGKPGSVNYFFEKTPALLKLVDAWNDQQARMKATPREDVILNRPEPEDVVRIIASAFDARKEFAELWKTSVPKLQVPRPGDIRSEFQADGSKVITHPGFKLIPSNASPATRHHLNL